MNQLSEKDTKDLCLKFFKQHDWERINYVNHTHIGYCPILLLLKDSDEPIFHLYDNFSDLLKEIKNIVENELVQQGGYSESFYLSLEDIDNLELQQYVTSKSDIEDVLQDAYEVLGETNSL